MARVVLVQSLLGVRERYGALAPAGAVLPSLGLLWVAARLRADGHGVWVVDADGEGLSFGETVRRVLSYSPDLAGLTAVTAGVDSAGRVARGLREQGFKGVIVIGGPHASAVPEETLSACPALDAAVLGEGEETAADLARVLDEGSPLSEVPGLWLAKGGRTAPRGPIQNLDGLPLPAWDLLPGFPGRYRPAIFKVRALPAAHLVTSRGCPYSCLFCDRSVFGNRVRFFSPGYVLEMAERLYRDFGVREIAFEDDQFLLKKSRVEEVVRGLGRMKGLSWTCLARADAVDDPALLKRMRRAGCWQVALGVESGDEAVLASSGKGQTIADVRRAAALCRGAGLSVKGFFILGLPGETRASLKKTLALARELPLNDASAFCFTPFPGGPGAAAKGRGRYLTRDYSRYTTLHPVWVPGGLSLEELAGFQRVFFRRFYFRPRIVLHYAGRAFSRPGDLPAYVKSLTGFMRFVVKSD